MPYFQDFPRALYRFGNEISYEQFQDLSSYVDIIDQIKDDASAYSKYYILDNERPDQLSYKLYGTPDYHWTFFMMNDNIREQGWPLSNRELLLFVQKELALNTITTKTVLTDKFKIGQTIEGVSSGATGTIDHRHLDLGQLVISNTNGTFTVGENVNSINAEGAIETISVSSYESEYLSAHHYEDANGVTVDIDPAVGPGALLTEVTYLDRYVSINDSLKEIRVLKRNVLFQIAEAFTEALKS
jgi:hypothetical protein